MISIYRSNQVSFGRIENHHKLKVQPQPLISKLALDAIELKPASMAQQIKFGGRKTASQMVQEFLDSQGDLAEAAKQLQQAMQIYKKDAKAASSLKDLTDLLEEVEDLCTYGIGRGGA